MSIKTIIVSVIVACCLTQTLSMVLGGQMPGGFGECVTPITQTHRDAAAVALSSINNPAYTLHRIICVKEQIVNGINYDIKLSVKVGNSCRETCDVTVFSGPFSSPTPTMTTSSHICSSNCIV